MYKILWIIWKALLVFLVCGGICTFLSYVLYACMRRGGRSEAGCKGIEVKMNQSTYRCISILALFCFPISLLGLLAGTALWEESSPDAAWAFFVFLIGIFLMLLKLYFKHKKILIQREKISVTGFFQMDADYSVDEISYSESGGVLKLYKGANKIIGISNSWDGYDDLYDWLVNHRAQRI